MGSSADRKPAEPVDQGHGHRAAADDEPCNLTAQGPPAGGDRNDGPRRPHGEARRYGSAKGFRIMAERGATDPEAAPTRKATPRGERAQSTHD